MLFSINTFCYFLTLLCYVLCEDDYTSSEYEHFKDMYDKHQRTSDSHMCFGLCKHDGKVNETFSKASKELTTTSDGSKREKKVVDKNFDEHIKEIREKASQKYGHPDDQELYLAARKYTPTLKSSEISSLIHSVNSRYKHILSSNDTFLTTKIVTTAKTKVTLKSISPRLTIFRAKHSSPSLDKSKMQSKDTSEIESVASGNTNVKEAHLVNRADIHQINSIQQNIQDEEVKSAAYHDSFKSFLIGQATKRNNPLNKFIDSIDDQNMYRPEPITTTEDGVYNSSYYRYIENQFHDFEERHKKHLVDKGFNILEKVTVFDEKKEAFYHDNLFDKKVFQNSAALLDGHYVDKLDISPDNQYILHTEKNYAHDKENDNIGQHTEKNIDQFERKTEPVYKSDYYGNPERVIQSKEATAFDKSQFYKFARDAQSREDAADKSEFYKLGDIENRDVPLRNAHIEETDKRDLNKTITISGHSIHRNKTKENMTLTKTKKGCPSCSNRTFHLQYQQQQQQRAIENDRGGDITTTIIITNDIITTDIWVHTTLTCPEVLTCHLTPSHTMSIVLLHSLTLLSIINNHNSILTFIILLHHILNILFLMKAKWMFLQIKWVFLRHIMLL
ncbi:hypothetical protein WDU94_007790 [Cyamophila willieti]